MTDRMHSREGWNPLVIAEGTIWLRDAETGEDANLEQFEIDAHARGTVANIETLAASDCECAASWFPGSFAPCDGPYGIQACDGCTVHGDDFDTAYALAAHLQGLTGRTFAVWYEAEPVIFSSETPRYLVRRWDGLIAERGLDTEEDARSAAMSWTGSHVEQQPQHNEPNPILVELRRTWREDRAHHENDLQLCADRVLMSDVEEPSAAEHFTEEQRHHAKRVLSRLIAILEPHRPTEQETHA